jgi:anaerobic magnesium-protoporphyrin IX monomethyl ester cyclase
MFKGAYTDAFYRAIRDALHAEVDSWKTSVPTAVARQSANFNELWREVDALEPASRNADATQIPIAIHSSVSSAPGVCRSSDLVSIRPLQAAAGEG